MHMRALEHAAACPLPIGSCPSPNCAKLKRCLAHRASDQSIDSKVVIWDTRAVSFPSRNRRHDGHWHLLIGLRQFDCC